jgi:tetratricopeptide (TPR) repeat protein
MRSSWAALLLAAPLLGGCGGVRQPATREDPIMRLHADAASSAMALDRTHEAIGQYRQAFDRAVARDDYAAIGDYGYNLAVAQLSVNQPKEALSSIRITHAELARRGPSSFPALDLAEATAYYRLGERKESDSIAAEVEAGTDPASAASAAFIRGLIADDRADAVGLDDAITRLGQPTSSDQPADLAELLARRDLRQGMFAVAAAEAERAADLRRDILDYRGMARALGVAANAEARAGDRDAATTLYTRAAQSVSVSGDTEAARELRRLQDEKTFGSNNTRLRE